MGFLNAVSNRTRLLSEDEHHEQFKTKWKISQLDNISVSPIKTWLRTGPPYPTDFDVETNVLVTCNASKILEIKDWLKQFEGNKIWYVDGTFKLTDWRRHFTALGRKKERRAILLISFEKRIDLAIFKLTFGPDILFTEQE